MVEPEFSCEKTKFINPFLKQMLQLYSSSRTEFSEQHFVASVNLYHMCSINHYIGLNYY